MRIRFLRRTILTLVVMLVIGGCFVEASAQKTRNKRSRRITNPVRSTQPAAQPTPLPPATTTTTNSDARIISTADDPTADNAEEMDEQPPVTTRRAGGRTRTTAQTTEAEPDNTRRTVNRLSRQVDKLTDKITQIEGQQRTLVDLERLSRAEQRAEGFRAQLRDVQAKEAELQGRLDQLEFDLRPENIERSAAFYGTTRPEEAREARRRQLENEKARTKSQLDLLFTSRTRLESAIASADTEVERLRARLDAEDPATTTPQPTDANSAGTTSTDTTPTTTTTTPPPTTPPNPSPYGTP